MTIQGAIAELQNLLEVDDVPFYYKVAIKKVIETISMEMADRKTEPNSSEKPNNCMDEFFREPTAEERKAVADYIDSISVPTGVNVFDLMDEPTISKMEQVEDETRLTAKCLNCANGGSYKCSKCDGEMYYKYDKDEPQTEKGGCTNCDGKDLCNNAFTEISQYCGAYEPQNGYQTFNGTSVYVSRFEEEPQTDCSWK